MGAPGPGRGRVAGVRAVAAVVAFSLLVGCELPFGPEGSERVMGTKEHYHQGPDTFVPGRRSPGEAFVVEVATYGGGCTRQGDTEVAIAGRVVVVTPWDRKIGRRGRNQVCTDELAVFWDRATLRFDEPGPVTVLFRGRQEPSGEVITVERTMVIE